MNATPFDTWWEQDAQYFPANNYDLALAAWDESRDFYERERRIEIHESEKLVNDWGHDHWTLLAMETFGGSFIKALAQAGRCADETNLKVLKAAWPEYWLKYTGLGCNLMKLNEDAEKEWRTRCTK